ncbi:MULTISPECIES: DUF4274 domain-containing protein [Bradyrhizobium]|uniref:DUF4274 domain-containing protein n=1 Tax=Bradyrhizobium TaxID=374 RepID=UPI00155E965B|nr:MULTISPECIES: DUF4274 domain-containing protein [Bradyrhizobium]MDD1522234.1 hypothetical protein [Bradyrhizobium sp. WBAH30]MDD1546278.1 hypothetical protein [Bradyrhizobium sp. WBAH41]MDD1559741.1 hypothetical protein [Bradyrhizobium sp. WBAH23]MDD1567573.1 hypothetical protein [Bradyrhizobium sp. WBAH33]MDD1593151.1 hypothetical protein [Bradyrhizobium sp. WBAH42]
MADAAVQDNQLPPDAREHVRNVVMGRCLAVQGLKPVFDGLSWEYFLDDVAIAARGARIRMRDMTVGTVCDTILLLPPPAIARLQAGLFVYFEPFAPENEAHAECLMELLDAATVKVMWQRRHAVHAMQAVEARQREAKADAQARTAALLAEWRVCPNAKLSTEPEDFLRWIKLQTPDTWHVIVESWDYNSDNRLDVVEWIFAQPTCDLGTAAQFFFTAGLFNDDPEQLSPVYRRIWNLMKRIADNWQRGFYARNELQPSVEPSGLDYYDELAARRKAAGHPLLLIVPEPEARRFGSRRSNSAYFYEHGHLRLEFTEWRRHRERLGCGRDFPRCCEM